MSYGALLYGVSKGVEAGVSSGAAKDAEKKQREAAIYQAVIARGAFKEGKKNLNPYAEIGRAQIAPYQQAIETYQAGIPGYFDQYQNYLNSVNQYNQQGIGGVNAAMADYQNILPNYQAAMDRYNQSIGRYEDLAKGYEPIMGEYGASIEDYKKALGRYNEAADLYKSKIPEMTKAYDMAQYKESPLYTPMVNNLAELQATPGYQFQLQQGQKALAQSAAARGGMLSGAQQQASQKFGQQQAATGFQDAWNRAQQAYGKAFEQNMANKQQLSNTLQANAGLYQNALAPTAQQANLVMGKADILGNQLNAAQAATGMYGTGVNQVGQQVDMYGNVVNQAMGRAGLFQNAANMQGQGLGYYGAGMGLLGQNVANRGAALDFGYGATKDIENYRKWANTIAQQSAGDYGTAGAQNALAQGRIWGGLAGNVLGAVGGYAANNGGFGNVFGGSTGSSPTWSGGVQNTQNRMGGFADLINSYGGRYP